MTVSEDLRYMAQDEMNCNNKMSRNSSKLKFSNFDENLSPLTRI